MRNVVRILLSDQRRIVFVCTLSILAAWLVVKSISAIIGGFGFLFVKDPSSLNIRLANSPLIFNLRPMAA
jgi:hypothetical protein